MKHLVPFAALALSACVVSADDTARSPDLSKMDWHLTEVDGKRPNWSATLNLGEPGRIVGQAPCNHFFGPLSRDGDSFKVGALAATEMACAHLEREGAFFAILGGITKAAEKPGLLILTGGGHEMRFDQPIN
jgi:heat shock protein HslJ